MIHSLRRFILLLCLFFHFLMVKGQNDAGQLIKSGAENANLIGKAYLKPLFIGLGVGFASGWASRADVRLGRVDLKFIGGLSFVPSEDQIFDASTLGLNASVRVNGSGLSPTVSGTNSPGAVLDIYANNPFTGKPQKVSSLNSPNGTSIHFIPVVVPQISVGLPFSTEISARFIPKETFGNAQVSIIGGALKHDISSHIPLMPFHFSLLAGYTQTNLEYTLNIQPDPGNAPNPGSDYSNQKATLKSNSLTVGVIASKTLAVLTVHVGASYNQSTGLLTATGTYPITTYSSLGTTQTTDIKDPINIQPEALSYFAASAGIQLKLGFFSILAEGTTGKYQSVNGGIGFSF